MVQAEKTLGEIVFEIFCRNVVVEDVELAYHLSILIKRFSDKLQVWLSEFIERTPIKTAMHILALNDLYSQNDEFIITRVSQKFQSSNSRYRVIFEDETVGIHLLSEGHHIEVILPEIMPLPNYVCFLLLDYMLKNKPILFRGQIIKYINRYGYKKNIEVILGGLLKLFNKKARYIERKSTERFSAIYGFKPSLVIDVSMKYLDNVKVKNPQTLIEELQLKDQSDAVKNQVIKCCPEIKKFNLDFGNGDKMNAYTSKYCFYTGTKRVFFTIKRRIEFEGIKNNNKKQKTN